MVVDIAKDKPDSFILPSARGVDRPGVVFTLDKSVHYPLYRAKYAGLVGIGVNTGKSLPVGYLRRFLRILSAKAFSP